MIHTPVNRPQGAGMVDDRVISAPFFWEELSKKGSLIAFVDAATGQQLTYADLDREVEELAEKLQRASKKFALLPIRRNLASVIWYLGLLRAGHAVALCDRLEPRMMQQYFPNFVVLPEDSGLEPPYLKTVVKRGFAIFEDEQEYPIEPRLAVMMQTSGSTRIPKFARLSTYNVAFGALQVVASLDITDADRAISSLPFSHIYGLSVLHSHLFAGASIILTERPIVDRAFWSHVADYNVTSLAGVPWTYEALMGSRLLPKCMGPLKKLTQSAGRLSPECRRWLVESCRDTRAVYFMYGQTEAAGRITVLPPEVIDTMGSVGYVVPGGGLKCDPDGQVIFSGPNVMLGYAYSRKDLASGDDFHGVLPTGDFGKLGPDGRLYLGGRKDRLCKLFGLRFNLDDIEAEFRAAGAVAVIADSKGLFVFAENVSSDVVRRRANAIANALGVPMGAFHVASVAQLPRNKTGKILYSALHTKVSEQTSCFAEGEGTWPHSRS